MCLSFPSKAFTPVTASVAATGVDFLMHQVKSGIQVPKPVQPEANAQATDVVPHTVHAPFS